MFLDTSPFLPPDVEICMSSSLSSRRTKGTKFGVFLGIFFLVLCIITILVLEMTRHSSMYCILLACLSIHRPENRLFSFVLLVIGTGRCVWDVINMSIFSVGRKSASSGLERGNDENTRHQ